MQATAIYTRISADKTGEAAGVARQESECKALAEKLGATTTDVFCDNDVSAFNGATRPAFEDMLAGVKEGRYSTVIAWHTDRLTRSMKDLERLIDVCDGSGTVIRTVTGGDMDLSTASGKMMARILASVARQESEHKSERQKLAFKQHAEQGKWRSSLRPFGYLDNGELHPVEADLLRQAGIGILSGRSLTSIAKEWSNGGHLTTFGHRWDTSRVKKTLTAPRNAALRTYKGEVVGQGAWEPIFTVDEYNGICAILKDPSRTRSVSYERRYLGSWRYICGLCGGKMKRTIAQHRDGRTYAKYACSESGHLARTQTPLDEFVESVALTFLRNQPAITTAAVAPDDGPDLDRLRARRQALAASKDELATLLADRVLTADAVRREAGRLQSEMDAIDKQLADAAIRSPLIDIADSDIDTVWAGLSVDMKGKVCDELFEVIVNPAPKSRQFRPEFIEFRWRHNNG